LLRKSKIYSKYYHITV